MMSGQLLTCSPFVWREIRNLIFDDGKHRSCVSGVAESVEDACNATLDETLAWPIRGGDIHGLVDGRIMSTSMSGTFSRLIEESTHWDCSVGLKAKIHFDIFSSFPFRLICVDDKNDFSNFKWQNSSRTRKKCFIEANRKMFIAFAVRQSSQFNFLFDGKIMSQHVWRDGMFPIDFWEKEILEEPLRRRL